TVRYLARSRHGRVELHLDRTTPYRRGEPIKITVRFPDDVPKPGPDVVVQVTMERRPPKGSGPGEAEVQTLTLTKVEGSWATYEAVLANTPVGDYQFWLREPAVAGDSKRAEAHVLAPPGEMEQLRMNQPEMEEAARNTRGRFYTLDEADRLPMELAD